MQRDLLFGSMLAENRPPVCRDPVVTLHGECDGSRAAVTLDESMIGKHMLLIGGTGCGKTNTFMHIVDQLKGRMSNNDVMIIFDTKGDYYGEFYDPARDRVISVDKHMSRDRWNVFREVLTSGFDRDEIDTNVSEIAWGLFSESIAKNSSNPFFPNAARDMFAAIITALIRMTGGDESLISTLMDNEYIRNFFDTLTVPVLRSLLEKHPDQSSVLTYVGDGNNPQGLGVFAELQTVIRRVFVGAFADKGDFSMRDFVRARGGRTLFIEYDLDRGATLTPIYKLLIDLALKEAMGSDAKTRASSGRVGNVYIFCDELKLLPDLAHLEDAVNFGRSLGVKVFAGLQSIDQLTENYGEARGRSIAAGFSTVFSFRANDENTRRFTSGRYGKNYILESFISYTSTDQTEEKRIGDVVEDWEICELDVGEAIIGLPKMVREENAKPFKFKFEEYRHR